MGVITYFMALNGIQVNDGSQPQRNNDGFVSAVYMCITLVFHITVDEKIFCIFLECLCVCVKFIVY